MEKIKEGFEFKQPVVPTSWEIISFQKAVSVLSDKGKRIKQKEYLQSGEFPIIDQGQDHIGGYTNDKNLVFDGT
jgi:type I restriction enzyme S subunit